jgi:hypothetical protein
VEVAYVLLLLDVSFQSRASVEAPETVCSVNIYPMDLFPPPPLIQSIAELVVYPLNLEQQHD